MYYPIFDFSLTANFVWMFLGWTSTKIVKIRVLPLFFRELWIICEIFGQFFKNLLL